MINLFFLIFFEIKNAKAQKRENAQKRKNAKFLQKREKRKNVKRKTNLLPPAPLYTLSKCKVVGWCWGYWGVVLGWGAACGCCAVRAVVAAVVKWSKWRSLAAGRSFCFCVFRVFANFCVFACLCVFAFSCLALRRCVTSFVAHTFNSEKIQKFSKFAENFKNLKISN